MQRTRIINGFSYALGLAFTFLALTSIVMATTATFTPESGKYFAYANVGVFTLLGIIFFSFPHSKRNAKLLLVFLLLSFAVLFLWLVFSQTLNTKNPILYQAGAIAFAVLLIARIGTSMRNRASKSDT